MENLALLEADVGRKSYTDWQTGFWKAFLLTVITFGIYGIYVLYKLLERREQHFERMVSFRGHLIAVLEEKAGESGRPEEFAADIAALKGLDAELTDRDRYGEKTPVLWLVLGILTGITNFYVYYFLHDDLQAHVENEERFMTAAAALIDRLGGSWGAAPATLVPPRSFPLYLVLTLVTLGLFSIYWWYTLITDPNTHFADHVSWEPQMLAAVSSL